jgi:hypothetical protein
LPPTLTDYDRSRFQSEHDYELIAEFDKEAGLANLEKAIKGPEYNPAPWLPHL